MGTQQSTLSATSDYLLWTVTFGAAPAILNVVLAYLVRVNIVARWTLLDRERGRELFEELLRSLDAKEKINKQ